MTEPAPQSGNSSDENGGSFSSPEGSIIVPMDGELMEWKGAGLKPLMDSTEPPLDTNDDYKDLPLAK